MSDAAAKPAPDPDPTKDWDKRLSAAYLRILGATQAAAAKAVGTSPRTLWSWEHDASWPRAVAEARDRWFAGADFEARRAIMAGLRADDQGSARWFLERADARLAPPAQRHEVAGRDGAPLTFTFAIDKANGDSDG